MRVILASGDTDLRLAIQLMLNEDPGIKIIGSANDTEGLIGLIMSTHPDLALMDWDLPGRPVKETIEEIKQYEFQIRLIVLGKHPGQKNDVLQAGADAYVDKSEAPEKLLLILQTTTTQ